ncbi:MAG: GldG family protein [Deltaproteobacteria bacterium]|nr:GldG family protein [Deltaproteobacteria bacterium]
MMDQKNKKRNRVQALATVGLVALALFLANVLFSRLFLRADLTEEKEYTLSESTRNVLKDLKDPVTLKVYFSKEIPPSLSPLKQRIFDLLDEYRVYSRRKINIVQVTPEESQEREMEAQMLGIPPLQLNVIRRDKQEVMKVYMGMALFYLDKKEVIPLAVKVENLEYDLTSAVLKLTSSAEPKLGLVVPPPENDQLGLPGRGPYSRLEEALKGRFAVDRLDPASDDLARSEISALLIVDPRDFPDKAKKNLDDLFEKGIPIVVLAGTVNVGDDLQTSRVKTGLEEWLKTRGIEIDAQLIIDPRNHTNATFTSGIMQYSIPYPFFVQVTREGLNSENMATAKLENILFPWTNTLKMFPDDHAGWKYTPLAQSSEAALTQAGEPIVVPGALENFQEGEAGKKTIAVLVEAPLPNQEDKKRLLVAAANTQFIKDHVVADYPGNLVFVQNLLDGLTLGDQLIGIRSRGKTTRPIALPSPTATSAIKFGHMVGIPLAVIGFGILLAFLRKKRREKAAIIYI